MANKKKLILWFQVTFVDGNQTRYAKFRVIQSMTSGLVRVGIQPSLNGPYSLRLIIVKLVWLER